MHSYEKDKKFGYDSDLTYVNEEGEEVEECMGCLAYHADLFHYFPNSENYAEEYDEDYAEYIRLIREGIYPVDGFYSGLYRLLFPEYKDNEEVINNHEEEDGQI